MYACSGVTPGPETLWYNFALRLLVIGHRSLAVLGVMGQRARHRELFHQSRSAMVIHQGELVVLESYVLPQLTEVSVLQIQSRLGRSNRPLVFARSGQLVE